jgi:hypothetical protein
MPISLLILVGWIMEGEGMRDYLQQFAPYNATEGGSNDPPSSE